MELKLRAWDDVLGEMLCSRLEQFDDSLLFRFNKHFETDKPIYMRPTWLKDKNGVEIYEGDKFQCGSIVGEVTFINGEFLIIWPEEYKFISPRVYIHAIEGEVIGNIYENPDLLP